MYVQPLLRLSSCYVYSLQSGTYNSKQCEGTEWRRALNRYVRFKTDCKLALLILPKWSKWPLCVIRAISWPGQIFISNERSNGCKWSSSYTRSWSSEIVNNNKLSSVELYIYSLANQNRMTFLSLILPKWSRWPLCAIRRRREACNNLLCLRRVRAKLCSCGAGGRRG